MAKDRRIKYPFFLIAGILLGILFIFFLISFIVEYRPVEKEVVFVPDSSYTKQYSVLPDTIKIVSWNIGYAGLGDDMDFFYDGGTKMRDTRERTLLNLKHIIDTLKKIDADIILLQEVDIDSHRTYGINELDSLAKAFGNYTMAFAYNYKAWFVPLPVTNPMGRVASGVTMLSRIVPLEVVRYNYPSRFSFPTRMFNLKRGLLSAKFLTSNGDTVMINNTHNTAYDEGGMREKEMAFLRDFLYTADSLGIRSITGGDWNQYPPDYIPSQTELSNPYFVPQMINPRLFNDTWKFVYEKGKPSLRYLDKPYSEESLTTLTDFFLLSPGLTAGSIRIVDNRFVTSDHNPVIMDVVIENEK